jgi:hypothetical protein
MVEFCIDVFRLGSEQVKIRDITYRWATKLLLDLEPGQPAIVWQYRQAIIKIAFFNIHKNLVNLPAFL